jgi:NlpC/P60 family putative phage cell wall peptidase
MTAAPAPPERRAAALIEARRWIGTPYRHGASARGAGADCLGLIRGVWRALYGAEPETPPAYTAGLGRDGGRGTALGGGPAAPRRDRAVRSRAGRRAAAAHARARTGQASRRAGERRGGRADPDPWLQPARRRRIAARAGLAAARRRRFRFPEGAL